MIFANKILSYLGIFFIALYCYGSLLLGSNFSEIRFIVPYIDFPVFLGEVLLAVCSVFFLFVGDNKGYKITDIGVFVFFVYVFFVLFKIFSGNIKWGYLAFRHAALFYYPLFIFICRTFVKYIDFNDGVKVGFVVLNCGILFFSRAYYEAYILTILLLSFLAAFSIKQHHLRIILILVLFLVFPWNGLFDGTRTEMVSNFIGMISVLVTGIFLLNVCLRYKVFIFGVLILFVVGGIGKYSKKPSLKSIISVSAIKDYYVVANTKISQRMKEFSFEPLKVVKVFNPNEPFKETKNKAGVKKENKILEDKGGNDFPDKKFNNSGDDLRTDVILKDQSFQSLLVNDIDLDENKREVEQNQRMQLRIGNILFRVFLWKDALKDLIEEKSFFGFAFGYPFRSESLEILNWAAGEWQRDGWVSIHNSYLHFVYRSGIGGVIILIFLGSVFLSFFRTFFINKSFCGIVFMGILLKWFFSAHFLPILELPHNAIFVWSMVGITWAYVERISTEKKKYEEMES